MSEASGLFTPDEQEEVGAMVDAFFNNQLGPDHHWVVYDDGQGPTGVVYYGPEKFGEGVFNLYMIAIIPSQQGSGLGTTLLRYVEDTLRKAEARLLLIDTSGLDDFELTRSFYRKNGYDEEARIRDYYKPGDDKVTFRKDLTKTK